jgi:hypothetical protein
MDGGPILYFPHNDWKVDWNEFASDIRKNWKTVNVFEIALSGSTTSGTLTFEGIENTHGMYFFTVEGDSVISINPGEHYDVQLSENVVYKTVFVTDNAMNAKRLPLQFAMGNPYPNPFCPTTKINYTLPYQWDSQGRIKLSPYMVSIHIYDIMGRKLRELVHRKLNPGNYSVTWDGKMENGRIVASGTYYCVLQAGDLKNVKQLMLSK